VPKNAQMTGLVRGAFALAPDHTLAAEVLYARNDQTSRVAPAPTSSNIPTSSPFFPAGATPTPNGIPNLNNPGGPNVPGGTANWRQVPAGKRQSEDDTINQRHLVEAFGTLAGFDYRAAVGEARTRSTAA
jgi:iron complex outermembrane receptor protein